MDYRIVFVRNGVKLPSTLLLTESTPDVARRYAVFSLQDFSDRYDYAEITNGQGGIVDIVQKPDHHIRAPDGTSLFDWGDIPEGRRSPDMKPPFELG
jgi:hypothetical protein